MDSGLTIVTECFLMTIVSLFIVAKRGHFRGKIPSGNCLEMRKTRLAAK